MGEVSQRYTIDGLGRIYSNGQDLWLPSVSTVLDVRETPKQLERWKKRKKNAGEYESTMSYKQNRGTLIHEVCLQSVMPTDPDSGEPIKTLWGKEEDNSEDELKANGNYERFEVDCEWAQQAWEYITTITGIGPNKEGGEVIDVETFVTNTDIGYAGQFDLLYYDKTADEVVLADIKTGKNVYEKNQIQLAAYAMAVPISVGRLEVLRLNPDQQDWEVFSSHDWATPRAELEDEFIRLRGVLEQENLQTIVETIKKGGKDAEGVVYEEMSSSSKRARAQHG